MKSGLAASRMYGQNEPAELAVELGGKQNSEAGLSDARPQLGRASRLRLNDYGQRCSQKRQ